MVLDEKEQIEELSTRERFRGRNRWEYVDNLLCYVEKFDIIEGKDKLRDNKYAKTDTSATQAAAKDDAWVSRADEELGGAESFSSSAGQESQEPHCLTKR